MIVGSLDIVAGMDVRSGVFDLWKVLFQCHACYRHCRRSSAGAGVCVGVYLLLYVSVTPACAQATTRAYTYCTLRLI